MGTYGKWQSWLWLITTRGALLYAGAILLLVLLQRHFIYFPSRAREEDLILQAGRDGMIPWRDSGDLLIGWRTPLPDAYPPPGGRLVVFHGNAGHALHRTCFVDGFRGATDWTAGWEIFLFEYPGYGSRPGPHSEENIAKAAREAIADLQQSDPRPLYLLGESLGSSFASRIAAENPRSIAGLILVTPLTCLKEVAASHYPFVPVRWMPLESHNVQEYLKAYPGPVAFLLAGRDEVMKNRVGEKLYEQYAGRSRLWMQRDAGHNTLDLAAGAPLWREIQDFLQQP